MPSLNERISAEQKETPPPINYLTLIFVIALGVTIGNLTSNYLTAKYTAYKLERAVKAMEAALDEKKEKLQAETKKLIGENRILAEKQQRERAQQQQIKRKLDETCNYWISEHNKLKSDITKGHRDVACRQAGRPFNN